MKSTAMTSATMDTKITQCTISTPADHQVVATRYEPATPHTAIIIAPAMGVPQRYYAPVAEWLAAKGFAVLTFDYYGMGQSSVNKLSKLSINVLDWAQQDCVAILDFVHQQHPDLPIKWLAHSVGGQLFGALPNHHLVDKMVTVTTGSGYWLENAPALKRKAWFLWFFMVPVTIPMFGYFPGKKLKMVGDLPKNVMLQWRRWCLHKDYLVGVEGEPLRSQFAAVKVPITSLSVTDDELLSARNIESLHKFYRSAPLRMIRIAPEDIGVKRIGHFGFFREEFASSLWTDYLLPELTGRA